MSAEAVQAFMEAILQNEELQKKLKRVADEDSPETAIVAIGHEAGFEFTADEWLEEQLTRVSGGGGSIWSTLGGAWSVS